MLRLIIIALIVITVSCQAMAGTVTTLTLVEKEGTTSTNYPLTFGHVFKQGDVTAGVIVEHELSDLTTQLDVKTTWGDGSVKFGVISVVVPQVDANGTETLIIKTGVANSSNGAMDETAILGTEVESNISLNNLSGSTYTGSLSSSLRDQVIVGDLEYWLQGPICTEILESQQLNNSLNAAWEARFYPTTQYGVRISNSIENVNVLYRGNINYDVAISIGETTPAQMYAKTGFDHLHGTRWRKVYWLGAEPPETELHYDTEYLYSTGAILHYNTALTVPEDAIAEMASAHAASDIDLGGEGLLQTYFPAPGGRPDIGMLPKWTAMYLLSYDNRLKKVVVDHGQIAGHVARLHAREGDVSKSNYGSVVTIDDRVSYDLIGDWGGDIPSPIGDRDTTPWVPDRSHHPSLAYIPYIVTGDYWLYMENVYWGGYVLSFDEYKRAGDGTDQDFSAGHDRSWGIMHDQVRGLAWSIRTLADSAFIALDNSIEKSYFREKLNNNFSWLYQGNQQGSHGLHILRTSREQPRPLCKDNVTPYPYAKEFAPWMRDFMVLVMRKALHQGLVDDEQSMAALLNYAGYFTIGRVTNHPDFNKWDGVGYWWPLADVGGTTYYNEGDWADFYAQVLNDDAVVPRSQGIPTTDLTRYDYSNSYLAIHIAALHMLTGLTDQQEAITFLEENQTLSKLASDPTWAFLPMPDLPLQASNGYALPSLRFGGYPVKFTE